MNEEREPETALSPNVKTLLCSIGIGAWPNDENSGQRPDFIHGNYVNETGLLDIKNCFKCLELDKDAPKDSYYYQRATFMLSPAYRECEDVWTSKDTQDFSNYCKHHFAWTKNTQLFLDCYKLLNEKQPSHDILALLLLCTGLEQALRSIFILENVQCPILLKDILASELLERYLGKDSIQLLHVLLGPPISMNLRNVAWHGFLSEGELSPRYVHFLLILIASVQSHSLSTSIERLSSITKQYFPLSKVESIMKSLVDLSDPFLKSMRQCVLDSWVTSEQNRNSINNVFHLHSERKYGFSSVQSFPILEHVLRRHFVRVNNCMDRLLTAEATTLYTTYEEILDPYLPDGNENKLICDLGEPFMDLLHDLLIYPNGPRARDRLGHGEADVYECPRSLSSTIIVCLTYLALTGKNEQINDNCKPCIQSVVSSVDNYESHFHPVAELKEKILTLSSNVTQIYSCLNIDPDLQPWEKNIPTEVFTKNNLTFHQITSLVTDLLFNGEKQKSYLWDFSVMKAKLATPFVNIHEIVERVLRRRVSTLHRWQKKEKCPQSNVSESEIVGLMHRIITETFTTLEQTEVALQQRQEALDNRLLRSRQRDNMKKLICLLPNLILAVNCQIVVLVWLFDSLNQPEGEHGARFKRIQKFLKAMLQIVENLRTYTSSDNNKWAKADEILLTFVKCGVELIAQFVGSS